MSHQYLSKIKEDYLLIKKSDIDKLGKKALIEVYEELNSLKYMDLKKTDKNLVSEMKKLKKELTKYLINYLSHETNKINQVKYSFNKKLTKDQKKYYKKIMEKNIDDKSFSTDLIYGVLNKLSFFFILLNI